MALIDKLIAIADAVRDKTGTTDAMTLTQIAETITGIETGGGGGEDLLVARITDTLVSYTNATITSIAEAAFAECKSLRDVNFPKVTSIGSSAFDGCAFLSSVNMPMVTTIGDYAFNYCRDLNHINFPELKKCENETFK